VSVAGRNVVVTGGAGFIGSHLVERLVGEGPGSLVVVDDLSTGRAENVAGLASVELVKADVCDDAARSAVADADVVFHLAVRNVRASINRPEENMRVNAMGTLAVLEAMRAGRRGSFVYVSSSEVYGIPSAAGFSESTVPAPTTVYGAGKLAGEHVALAYRRVYEMDTRVVRPFNNFGPRSHFEGDSGEVIPKFVLRALAGRPLHVHGDGSQTRDFMYVEDTARWLVRLAFEPALVGETVNIGSGRDVSVLELAQRVLELTRSSSEIVHVEARPGDLPRLVADTSKISSLVDFRLDVDFEEGLRRTVEFFAAQDVEALLADEVERNWT